MTFEELLLKLFKIWLILAGVFGWFLFFITERAYRRIKKKLEDLKNGK